jgi:hypothetical protein
MPGPAEKDSRFKPADPVIPGVPQRPPEEKKKEEQKPASTQPPGPRPVWQTPTVLASAGVGALMLLAGATLAWQAMKPAPAPAPVVLPAPATTATPEGSAAPATEEAPLPDAPGPVATVAEMAKPWSVAKFRIRRSTGQSALGMVIRLPSAPGYWGLLSVAPYGQCEMGLETDLAKIRRQYGYAASHPMVVDSCTQVVYDPLALGSSSGVWVRGRVAAGPGIRPPFAVEIKTEQGYVVASRSE